MPNAPFQAGQWGASGTPRIAPHEEMETFGGIRYTAISPLFSR